MASERLRATVVGRRPAVTYGPAGPSRPQEWVLTAITDEGRVELCLDEDAMYDLWTEVRGVPWPEAENDTEDRLVRRLVQYANGADEAMLHDALEALGAER